MSKTFDCFTGTFVHFPQNSTANSNLEIKHHWSIVVNLSTGRIEYQGDLDDFRQCYYPKIKSNVRRWYEAFPAKGEFFIPGLIDTHVHAAQFQFAGMATDLHLMEWLEEYAFPSETRLSDLKLAERVYSELIETLIISGTTTAMYFGVLNVESCSLFVDVALKTGQRALIGKVCMDQNSPENYSETFESSIETTEHFIRTTRLAQGGKPEVHNPDHLVLPVITPRFIPTCSLRLLNELGNLAKQLDVHIQSHISESLDEIEFVQSIHPDKSDCEIFENAGLLSRKSVFAHGVHLSDEDVEKLGNFGSSISHCPLSNFLFAQGTLNTLQLLQENTCNVSLGTDVAGGYSTSMLNSMRNVVIADCSRDIMLLTTQQQSSKRSTESIQVGQEENVRSIQVGQEENVQSIQVQTEQSTTNSSMGSTITVPQELNARKEESFTTTNKQASRKRASHYSGRHKLDFMDAFWIATRGGAIALDMQNKIGSFEKDFEWDALKVSVPGIEIIDDSSVKRALEKFINCGDDRNVLNVWVKGKQLRGHVES